MKLVDYCIRQPISVGVGVGLSILAGVMALTSVPVQMKPDVDSVVISISTYWESASAEEIESDIVEEQEKVLSDVSGLVSVTSNSKAGQGVVRLEFETGTDLEAAKADVLQKLDEVPGYPDAVLRPVVEDIDPESVDYIAWVGLSCTDTNFDTTTLFDFMERRMKPRFDRLKGVAQVGIRGGRYSELQIRVDPRALAERGLTWRELNDAIRNANANFSAGKLEEGKRDIRVRSTGRFESAESVMNMIVRRDEAGPVYMRDVAEVIETYKEKTDWARARGHEMPFFNFLLRQGGNLIETMELIKAEIADMNAPGGLLEQHARSLGLNGKLELVQVYDSTTYVEDAIDLVQSNIVYGGILATLTLLFFLKSLRTVGIIALAIPISVVAAIVVLVMLGRSVNIISLAGMAFAVGMVVDNAIVVIENIFRHLEMGKDARSAANDGASEVGGAVVASTITTLAVFFPILLIQETAGQLFKDIAYAIMAAVALSLVVSLTVIPAAAARILRARDAAEGDWAEESHPNRRSWSPLAIMQRLVHALPHAVADTVAGINRSWPLRLLVIAAFIVGTIAGIKILIPPLDYLPKGNRNIVFGLLIPPPGYNLDQLSKMGRRIENIIRPAWDAAPDQFAVEAVARGDAPKEDQRVPVPPFPGMEPSVTPPPIDNYFLVSFEGMMFHGAISADKKRVKDLIPLLNTAAGGHNAPDTIAFAFQMPLFRVGGNTGSAIKIDIKGRNLDEVSASARSLMFGLIGQFGPYSVNPDPSNFLMPSSEMRVEPNDRALLKVGLTRSDIGLAAQANGDGILFFRKYERNGELRDMKVISRRSIEADPVDAILNAPIATPSGEIVDLRTLATVSRVLGPDEIRHVDRARAVTLQFTPPAGMPLETAVNDVNKLVEGLRAQGGIAPGIEVGLAGSAGKLTEIKNALLGDGSWLGTMTSSMFLAFFVVYLVLVVLFQSWSSPVVIMLTVPLATLGGFGGLALVHYWSTVDPYMPVQNLDMLSILGFVLLAGVVVNNAILIIHQTLNFMNDPSRGETPDEAIIASVRSRVRPILMSSLTSVGGMIPLVLLPGAGSELYRGLGAVVVGGLLVSTIFTLVLVPAVLSVFFAAFRPAAAIKAASLCLCAVITFGTACTTVTERMSPDADAQIPNTQSDYLHKSSTTDDSLPEQWWKIFNDPTLDELIARLNEANPDADAALARADQSFAVLGITRGPRLPTVRGNAGLGRRRDSINNLLFPIASPEYNRFQLGLSATWEIDLWGRVRSTVKRDRFRAEAAAVDYQALLLSLQTSLTRQYFTYRAAETELALLRQVHQSHEENVRLEEARLKFGQAVQTDVSRARIGLQNAATAVEAAERNAGKLLHAIAVLTGTLPSELTALSERHEDESTEPAIPAGLPSDLLTNRPDLLAADRQLRAAATQVGIRRADFLPKITLVGSGGVASLNADNLFEADSGFFDLGPQVDIPLFQYGVRKHSVGQARAQFREAAANYRSAFLTAVREVDDALLDARSYTREREQQAAAVTAATETADAARDRHETGLGTYAEHLTAEQTRLQTLIRQNTLRNEHRLATLRLIQALGTSWATPQDEHPTAD